MCYSHSTKLYKYVRYTTIAKQLHKHYESYQAHELYGNPQQLDSEVIGKALYSFTIQGKTMNQGK